MDITIVNVALDSIQDDLNSSNAGLQWSINSYMITFAAFIFTGGICADRFGRKKTLIGSLVIFGIASALAAFSDSITELIIWRSIMGIGAAVVPTVTLAILINYFPPAERPRAIATWATTGGVAFAVGPIVGGLLLIKFWWGSVFLINAPIVIVSVALIAWLIPESRNTQNSKFDPTGVLISILAAGALIYGIVAVGHHSDWTDIQALGPIIGGLVLVVVLVVIERRLAAPSLDLKLFESARFSAGTAAIALSFFAFMGAIYITTFYFQAVRGYSAFQAGLLMFPMGIGSIITATSCPKLVARFGPRAVVAGGAFIVAAAFVCYSQFDANVHLWLLIVVQLLFGLGWGCIMAPATASLMSIVPPAKAGAGQAVAQTLRQIGAALGVAFIGSLLGVLYRSSFGSTNLLFPSDLRDGAADSIGGTLGALQTVQERIQSLTATAQNTDRVAADQLFSLTLLQQQTPMIVDRAVEAYMTGMQFAMLIAAAVALLAAFIAFHWLPAHLATPGASAAGQSARGNHGTGRASEKRPTSQVPDLQLKGDLRE